MEQMKRRAKISLFCPIRVHTQTPTFFKLSREVLGLSIVGYIFVQEK
jgi:hypothetical protein